MVELPALPNNDVPDEAGAPKGDDLGVVVAGAPPKLKENPDDPPAAGVVVGVVEDVAGGVAVGAKLNADGLAVLFAAGAGVEEAPNGLGVLVPAPNAEDVEVFVPKPDPEAPPLPNAEGVLFEALPKAEPEVPVVPNPVFPNPEDVVPKGEGFAPPVVVLPNGEGVLVVPNGFFAGSFAVPNGEGAAVEEDEDVGPKPNLDAPDAVLEVPFVVGAPDAAVVGVLKLNVGPAEATVGGFVSAPAPNAPLNDDVLPAAAEPGAAPPAGGLLKLKLNLGAVVAPAADAVGFDVAATLEVAVVAEGNALGGGTVDVSGFENENSGCVGCDGAFAGSVVWVANLERSDDPPDAAVVVAGVSCFPAPGLLKENIGGPGAAAAGVDTGVPLVGAKEKPDGFVLVAAAGGLLKNDGAEGLTVEVGALSVGLGDVAAGVAKIFCIEDGADGAVTVMVGTLGGAAEAASSAFLSASAFSLAALSFSCLSFSARSLSNLALSAAAARSRSSLSFNSLSSFSFDSRSISFFLFASRTFIMAFASNSCFSHFEKTLWGFLWLPFVLSESPGELLVLEVRLSARDEDAMRFTVGMGVELPKGLIGSPTVVAIECRYESR